jgi:hypothetical protein
MELRGRLELRQPYPASLKGTGEFKWQLQNDLRSETVGVKPYRYWGLPGCRCRWPAERPRQAGRRRTQRRKISHQITKCFSVKRKSRTSVCRRSTSSTRKTPQRLRSVNKLPIGGGAAAAAADVARADVAGDAARAVAAAEAAAGPGAVAVGARLEGFPGRICWRGFTCARCANHRAARDFCTPLRLCAVAMSPAK